jgi:hypothetical protein
MILTGQNTLHILKTYVIETYTVTYPTNETLKCTFHCTTLCTTQAGLGYRYHTTCFLLHIVINEDTGNMHQIRMWHPITCNTVLVSRNWLHHTTHCCVLYLTLLWYNVFYHHKRIILCQFGKTGMALWRWWDM